MTNIAPSLPPRIEALLPLMRGWLVGVAMAVLARLARSNGRHARLLKPFVLRLERNLANWLFLSTAQRVGEPIHPCTTRRPRFAPRGFRRNRAATFSMRRFVRLSCRASLTERLARVRDIAANPERAIARLAARLTKIAARGGFIAARLVAIAPPARLLGASAPASTPALADSS